MQCDELSLRVNFTEGMILCTNCGLVYETDLLLSTCDDDTYIELRSNDTSSFTDYYDCGEEDIPLAISEEAKTNEQLIMHKHRCRSNNHDAIRAACLFFAYKKHKVPRTHAEICKLCRISTELLSKGIKVCEALIDCSDSTNLEYVDLINRYCSAFNINKRNDPGYFDRIHTIYNQCEDVFEGKAPKTITCSIMAYLFETEFLSYRLNKKDVSTRLGITLVTLNKQIKLIVNHLLNI
jgi:transcription initiation factor TFIIIB Brf1 subunit/transcription initiation factor TFIIB